MKNKLFLSVAALLIAFSFLGCSKDNTPVTAPVDTSFDVANATLLRQGTFSGNRNYTVSGSVKLYDFKGKKYIYFENFSSNNGPDLKVYIATSNNASQFISLGALKATSGTQVYLITAPPDFAQYNRVLIWCQQFSVLFGASGLQ